MKSIILILLVVALFACGGEPEISGRWYSEKQVTQGALVFKKPLCFLSWCLCCWDYS